MRRNAVIRVRVISGIVLALLSVLIFRLVYIQILHHEAYVRMGESQYVHTVQELYSRGSIYFKTKEGELVSAATLKGGYVLALDPSRIKNPEQVFELLNEIVPLDREYFFERVSKTSSSYQEVHRSISNEDAERISARAIPGVSLYKTQWRYYPGKNLAAHTVGFIGYTDTKLVGKYGLERYYNDVLERDRETKTVNFFAEIFSNIGAFVFNATEDTRGDIVTTIEPSVARTLDKVLESAHQEWNSRITGGIIMNPKTGEIYALSIVPTYDLNDRSDVSIESFRNPLIEDVYELGSIIKPLTVAAGLDAGVIAPYSTYYDAGSLTLNEYTIRNFDGRGRGTVPIQEILSQSLNTGVAHIASLLGKERFRSYFYALKLGSETGIDLPNESHGLVKNLESPREVEYATASFGQGIALTPIAAVRALATLANGGVLVTPHIAHSIVYEDGDIHTIGYPDGERVFSEAATEATTRMLVEVVDTALRRGTIKNEYYTVAAKTGTAQIANVSGGGYSEDKFLHSFFGYFPAYDPQFLIFLYTVEPKGVQYASETLTEPFHELVKFLINYYAVPPDR